MANSAYAGIIQRSPTCHISPPPFLLLVIHIASCHVICIKLIPPKQLLWLALLVFSIAQIYNLQKAFSLDYCVILITNIALDLIFHMICVTYL